MGEVNIANDKCVEQAVFKSATIRLTQVCFWHFNWLYFRAPTNFYCLFVTFLGSSGFWKVACLRTLSFFAMLNLLRLLDIFSQGSYYSIRLTLWDFKVNFENLYVVMLYLHQFCWVRVSFNLKVFLKRSYLRLCISATQVYTRLCLSFPNPLTIIKKLNLWLVCFETCV